MNWASAVRRHDKVDYAIVVSLQSGVEAGSDVCVCESLGARARRRARYVAFAVSL